MQVDLRSNYASSALQGYIAAKAPEMMTLSDMSRPSLIFDGGEISRHNYAFSRCVVEHWLQTEDLTAIIDGIGWRRPFPVGQFHEAKAQCSAL